MSDTYCRTRCLLAFLVSFILLSNATLLAAGSFYVDNQAAGNNNGSSWTDAWESFADINWSSVTGGDTIYISGGTSSKTYFETFTFGASGSSESMMIKLDTGANSPSPAGHDGIVIIDGGRSRSSGIVMYNRQYCTVYGAFGSLYKLLLQNHTGISVGSVQVRNSSYCYIDYVKIDNAQSRGIFFDNADHSRMRGCDIRTGIVSNNVQSDCIYMQFGNDNVVEDCTAILGNDTASQHIDCLQISNQENRLVIRQNWLEWINGRGNDQSQAFIIEDSADYVYFYNNVVIGGSNNPYQAALFKEADPGGIYYIWNNTIISQNPSGVALNMLNCTNGEIGAIKNNIIYSYNDYCLWIPTALSPTSKVDYNCLYRGTGSYPAYVGGQKSWSQYQAAGYDINGINQDPQLDSIYRPLQDSPVIDKGINLASIFTTDIVGLARPEGPYFDIGAYEFTTANRPDPPLNLRLK